MNMLRSSVSQAQRRRTIGRTTVTHAVRRRDVRPATLADLQPHAELYQSVAFSDEGWDFPDDLAPIIVLNPAVRDITTVVGPRPAVFFHRRDASASEPLHFFLDELFQPDRRRLPLRRLWIGR